MTTNDYQCPNCGDVRPGKLRLTCEACGTTTCVWCSRDFHALGVHPTGKTLRWHEPVVVGEG